MSGQPRFQANGYMSQMLALIASCVDNIVQISDRHAATTSPTRGIRAGRAMLCPVVPRGRLRRSLVVALRAHALDVLLHALLMSQASKRHSPAAGSKGHS